MSLTRTLRINDFCCDDATRLRSHCDTGFFTATFPRAHPSFGNHVPLGKYSWSKCMRRRGGNAGGRRGMRSGSSFWPPGAPLFLLNFHAICLAVSSAWHHTRHHSSVSSVSPAILFIFFLSCAAPPWRLTASTSPRLARSRSIPIKRYSWLTRMIQRRFGESSEMGEILEFWARREVCGSELSTGRTPKSSPSFRSASARKYWYSSGAGMDRSSTLFLFFCQFSPFYTKMPWIYTFTSSTTAVVIRSVRCYSISLVARK